MRSAVLFTVLLLVSRPVMAQQCRADFNGSGAVEINEIIQVVNEALGGCDGAAGTPTRQPTPTRTPTAVPNLCPYKFNDSVDPGHFCGYQGTTTSEHCAGFNSGGGWTTADTTVIAVFADPDGNTIALDATRTNPTTARVTGLSFGPDYQPVYQASGTVSLPSNTRLRAVFDAGGSCGKFTQELQFFGFLGDNASTASVGSIAQLRASLEAQGASVVRKDDDRVRRILQLRDAIGALR